MAKKGKYFRRKLLIDRSLQFKMIGYSAFVSLVLTSFVFSAYFIWQNKIATQPEPPVVLVCLLMMSGICAIAITLYLGLIVTNQIAGPIYRLRTEMKSVADGGTPREINVRDGDMLGDSFYEYNRLVKLLKDDSRRTGES